MSYSSPHLWTLNWASPLGCAHLYLQVCLYVKAITLKLSKPWLMIWVGDLRGSARNPANSWSAVGEAVITCQLLVEMHVSVLKLLLWSSFTVSIDLHWKLPEQSNPTFSFLLCHPGTTSHINKPARPNGWWVKRRFARGPLPLTVFPSTL